MPRALTVFQFLGSLLRFRVVRAFLWFLASLWLFDRFIYFLTEGQWFASVHLQNLWWARCRAQSQLFIGFFLLGGLLTWLFLRPIAKIAPDTAPPLRGKLSRFQPLRSRALGRAWVTSLVIALLGARGFANNWSQWLYLRGGSHHDSLYLGLPVGLWTHTLPVLSPLLHALWLFSWFLLAIVGVTGVLVALPQLAVRQPAPPHGLTKTLWCLGAWLLGLRALLHGAQILDLARGRALETGDVYISAPIFGLGALGCLVLGAIVLRRAGGSTTRANFSKLALGMMAALWLPGLLNWLATPERSLLAETRGLKRLRQSSTMRAWNLNFAAPQPPSRDVAPEVAWPMWDEKSLLQVLSPTGFRKGHVVTWKTATLHLENGRWHALAAGESVGATAWMADRYADKSTQLPIDRLDFSPETGGISRTELFSEDIFFGFEGRTLFREDNVGVPIQSMLSKWLWAWRLRDLFLPFDSINNNGMLLFRGAQERAEKVAPFWKVAGPPQLMMNGQSPVWMVDLCAVTSNYPGAMSATAGELTGYNGATDGLKMLVDARDGDISFYSIPAPTHDALLEDWRAAVPKTLKIADQMPTAVRKEWRAAPEMLSAQFTLSNQLHLGESGFERIHLYQPILSFQAGSGVVERVLGISKKGIEMLESPSGATTARVLRRASFDLGERLGAIDSTLAKKTKPEWLFMAASEPFVWPAASAPGGYWIGRVSFATPQNGEKDSVTSAKPMEWRVALTGATPDAAIGVGTSVRGAMLNFLGQTTPDLAQSSNPAEALEIEALRAHNAEIAAARNGNWKVFAQKAESTRKLLEQMVAERKLSHDQR